MTEWFPNWMPGGRCWYFSSLPLIHFFDWLNDWMTEYMTGWLTAWRNSWLLWLSSLLSNVTLPRACWRCGSKRHWYLDLAISFDWATTGEMQVTDLLADWFTDWLPCSFLLVETQVYFHSPVSSLPCPTPPMNVKTNLLDLLPACDLGEKGYFYLVTT